MAENAQEIEEEPIEASDPPEEEGPPCEEGAPGWVVTFGDNDPESDCRNSELTMQLVVDYVIEP